MRDPDNRSRTIDPGTGSTVCHRSEHSATGLCHDDVTRVNQPSQSQNNYPEDGSQSTDQTPFRGASSHPEVGEDLGVLLGVGLGHVADHTAQGGGEGGLVDAPVLPDLQDTRDGRTQLLVPGGNSRASVSTSEDGFYSFAPRFQMHIREYDTHTITRSQ